MEYFLGRKPVAKTSDNKILVKDIVNNIDDIIVINDEAHHIHDTRLAWYKTIESISNNLYQKRGQRLNLQLDVSATPKDTKGNIFPHTITDYPLVEAIAQNVVKTHILPDEASRGKLNENISSKFSEKYRDYIDLGVTVWEKDYKHHKKLGKKAVLFVMVDDIKNSEDVKEYLENNYPLLRNGTFIIHTNTTGNINENIAAKSQKELRQLRELANNVDDDNNDVRAVISVLMLKEGWDVKNVTTVIGLRPFSSKSNILPEQALGRGLRRMYFGEDIDEELNVIGTPAFMEFVETIKSEGVILQKRRMDNNSDPSGPKIIEINRKKRDEKIEIEIPVLSPSLSREYKDLNDLDVDTFDFESITIKSFSEEDQKNILFRDIIDDAVVKEVRLHDSININPTSIVLFFTKSIMTDLRLFGGQEILYEKIKYFITQKLFNKTIDIKDPNIARNLSESNVREKIRQTFIKQINNLTLVKSGSTEVQNYIKVSNQKPFTISKKKPSIKSKKSLFGEIVGDSKFEITFAGFLEAAIDVSAYEKNYIELGFKLDYQNDVGGISYYHPDFVVKLKNGSTYIVETKGAENINDPRKIERLMSWCEDAMNGTGKPYNYLYLRQEEWEKLSIIPNTFEDLIESIY